MSEPDRAAQLAAARRALCIQPHYDDNDLGAGGTLASLAERGADRSFSHGEALRWLSPAELHVGIA